ncbi:MAG: MmcQ/YjbR family DNA-binding protein [Acidimicrobiia bacterium]
MRLTKRDDQRRARVSELCLGLPEATSEVAGRTNDHTTFFVRKKRFAYHLVDHDGDGRVQLSVRAEPGQNAALVERQPDRYFWPRYIGVHGWVGLQLDLPKVDWGEVESLVVTSYRLQAPKTLVKLLDS